MNIEEGTNSQLNFELVKI